MLGVLASAALGAGLLINQCRAQPLPMMYRSKAERLQLAVAKLAVAKTVDTALLQPSLPHDISLDDFRVFVAGKYGVILDARPEVFYRLGMCRGRFPCRAMILRKVMPG